MKAQTQKSQPKAAAPKRKVQTGQRINIKEALRRWMKGEGRSTLTEVTGLTRMELRQEFQRASGKSWRQLNEESHRIKQIKQPAKKEVRQRKVA